MQRFRPDEYLKPSSIQEAARILREHGITAKVVAGGTELNELAKRGMLPHVKKLVDIENLGLDFVRNESSFIAIGAMTTIATLMRNPTISLTRSYGALKEAAQCIEPTQVRNVATIGGALCSALPFFDLPTAVLAMDANLHIVGGAGSREMPSHEFFLDYFLPSLRAGEILAEVRIPKFSGKTISGFDKFQVTAEDLALVNIGARVTLDESNVCREVRIVVGGRGTTRIPTRLGRSEKALLNYPLSAERIDRVSDLVQEEIQPISDQRSSNEYRRQCARVLMRRLLKRLSEPNHEVSP